MDDEEETWSVIIRPTLPLPIISQSLNPPQPDHTINRLNH